MIKPPTDEERARDWWADYHNHAWVADEEAIADLTARFAAVREEARRSEADEMLRLVEDLRYIKGIVERGEQRTLRANESITQAMLNYVKSLERAKADLVEALKQVEWVQSGAGPRCLWCYGTPRTGHGRQCPRQLALAGGVG